MREVKLPVVIRIRVSEQMLKEVSLLAERQQRDISYIVRKAISQYIKRRLE